MEVGEECHDVLFHHAELGDGFNRAVAPLLLAADADKEARTAADMAALLNASAAATAANRNTFFCPAVANQSTAFARKSFLSPAHAY